MLTLDKVFNAQTVLKNIIRETNVVRAYGIAPDCELYLKPENLQITGSFKVRGSAYKIAMLSEEEKAKGVIACSAGNHAQGVALAATKNGIKSLICLPDTAPISKVEATRVMEQRFVWLKAAMTMLTRKRWNFVTAKATPLSIRLMMKM